MRNKLMLLGATLLAGMAANAHATTIVVTPAAAPNAFGSPSYAGWVANAITALHGGLASYGDSSLPTYYLANPNVTANQVVVTGFNSWLGQADPGNVFGPAFAAELGNRMLFGIRIDGEGTQFSIDQLSFAGDSNGPGVGLDFSFGTGSYTYSLDYQGVLAGTDGILWTGDDVFITSGPASQLVDGLVGRGSGSSYAAYCPGCTVEQQQAAIDAVALDGDYPTQFTGTYTLNTTGGPVTGSGSFSIAAAVPEPGTWAMMILGFGLMGGMMRRRTGAALAHA